MPKMVIIQTMKLHCVLLIFIFAFSPQITFAAMTHDQARSVLGVSKDADPKAIKAARTRLLKIYHPDIHGVDGKGETQKIIEAYETLMAPEVKSQTNQTAGSQSKASDFEFAYGFSTRPEEEFHSGLHTSYRLQDFKYNDIIQRTGDYEQFYAKLSYQLSMRIRALGNPYYYPLAKFWRYQVDLFRHYDWRLKAIMMVSLAGPFMAQHDQGLANMLPVAGLAMHSILSFRDSRMGKIFKAIASREFLGLIKETAGTDDSDKKKMLFSYDIVETIALNQIKSSDKTSLPFMYSRILRLLNDFPLAAPGFALRAFEGVGLAGQLRAEFEKDLAARPRYWKKQMALAESFSPASEKVCQTLLSDYDLN